MAGGLLGKLGIALDAESERRYMIRRLKSVKDPAERDRIIWALEGQRREDVGSRPFKAKKSGLFEKTGEKRPLPGSLEQALGLPSQGPAERPVEQTMGAPQPPLKIGNLMGYAVPALFIFFGISNIGRALEGWAKGANNEEVLIQFLIGGMFIVFAVAGLFSKKAKKTLKKER